MKQLITGLLVLALMLSCGMTALAAEAAQNGGAQDIDVYAKAQYDVEGVYPAPVTDGAAAVTTDEDITVSVTDAPESAVRLVVIPVSEQEALQWITDSLKTTAEPVHIFDIYFEDADGSRIDADGAAVTVDCPHCADVPVVCSLDTDGEAQVLTASAQGTAVSFTTDGSPYYILAEKLDPESGGQAGGPIPGTGDNSKMGLWCILLIASGAAIAQLTFKRKPVSK